MPRTRRSWRRCMAGGGQRGFWRNALRVRAGPRAERSWIENPSVPLPPHRRRWLVPDGADASAWRAARGAGAARLRRRLHGAAAAGVPAGARPRHARGRHRQHGDAARLGARDARGRRLGPPLRRPPAAARRRAADGRDRRRLRRLRVVLAAAAWSPSSARSTRARATSASSCRSSTRAWRTPRSGHARAALFARYSVLGALFAALGALAAAAPDVARRAPAYRAARRAAGDVRRATARSASLVWLLYRRLPRRSRRRRQQRRRRRRSGRRARIVVRLAALFSVDAFAGGLVVNSLLALWLFERFGLSLAQAAAFFFWTGLLSAASQLAAPRVARRIGLLNTMVFTHIPANVCLVRGGAGAERCRSRWCCCSCAARCRRWTCRRGPPT